MVGPWAAGVARHGRFNYTDEKNGDSATGRTTAWSGRMTPIMFAIRGRPKGRPLLLPPVRRSSSDGACFPGRTACGAAQRKARPRRRAAGLTSRCCRVKPSTVPSKCPPRRALRRPAVRAVGAGATLFSAKWRCGATGVVPSRVSQYLYYCIQVNQVENEIHLKREWPTIDAIQKHLGAFTRFTRTAAASKLSRKVMSAQQKGLWSPRSACRWSFHHAGGASICCARWSL